MSKICYECFRNINDEYNVCPHCNFDFRTYKISERALHPGTVLNKKYVIGKTLGEGGFGITYLAWDRYMNTKIAIKEYYPSNVAMRDKSMYGGNTLHVSANGHEQDFEAGLKRYVQEAVILNKFFNLPGIVSVKDFFYENGTAYIVMEYIEGISLKQYMKDKGGKMTSNESLNIIEPIIKSLAVIHKNKLLHRDISPDNIMISKEGKIKLIDFGAARYFSDDTEKSMTVVLKHGYAPIEQYSRKGEQGEWTDVYALCAVIYRMMTGVVPSEAVERVNKDDLIPIRKINKKVPKYIAKAIERGLSVQPEKRQHDMQELYLELYVTENELKEKTKKKIVSTMIKLLIILVVVLVIVIEVFFMNLLKNKKDTSDENSQKVTTYEDIFANAEDKEADKKIDEEEDNKESEVQSVEQKAVLETENTQAQVETVNVVQTQQTEPVEEKKELDIIQQPYQVEQPQNEIISQSVVIVRDGVLNGRSENYTVGKILDTYSETAGRWSTATLDTGNPAVYYTGTKNGETFTIIFEVDSGSTFKLIGATRNGVIESNYSSFFQQILNEVGV